MFFIDNSGSYTFPDAEAMELLPETSGILVIHRGICGFDRS